MLFQVCGRLSVVQAVSAKAVASAPCTSALLNFHPASMLVSTRPDIGGGGAEPPEPPTPDPPLPLPPMPPVASPPPPDVVVGPPGPDVVSPVTVLPVGFPDVVSPVEPVGVPVPVLVGLPVPLPAAVLALVACLTSELHAANQPNMAQRPTARA